MWFLSQGTNNVMKDLKGGAPVPQCTADSQTSTQKNRREAADDEEGGSWGSRKAVLGNTFLFLLIKILKRIEIGHVALCGRASFVTLLPQPPTC